MNSILSNVGFKSEAGDWRGPASRAPLTTFRWAVQRGRMRLPDSTTDRSTIIPEFLVIGKAKECVRVILLDFSVCVLFLVCNDWHSPSKEDVFTESQKMFY